MRFPFKRCASLLLALMMTVFCASAFAEAPAQAEEAPLRDSLLIGVSTQMSGGFFSEMWGNNTADVDIRTLIHGLRTVSLKSDGMYAIDPTVVLESTTDTAANGDKTYTLKLNPALAYSDGTPITARDYAFSALLLSCPQVGGMGLMQTSMSHLKGYAAFASGESQVFSGVRVLSDDTLRLTISGEFLPYFYELKMIDLTPYPIHVIAPSCALADDGQGAYIQGEMTEALLTDTLLKPVTGYRTHPSVVSGPYVLDEYDEAAHVAKLSINPYYAGNFEGQKPTIQHLTVRQIDNADMIAALKSGEIDLISKVSDGGVITEAAGMIANAEVQGVNYLRSGFGFVSCACELGATRFKEVRQALAMCLDAESICTDFLKGFGMPVYGYYGYGQWMASQNMEALDALDVYGYNIEGAKAVLAENGWTYNERGEPFTDGVDAVRYKATDAGEMIPLSLSFVRGLVVGDNGAGEIVERQLLAAAPQIGMALTAQTLSFSELLKSYYRQADRTYNLFFLATNFDNVFDPYYTFHTDDAYQGVQNTTGIRDAALMEAAQKMRDLEPGDLVGYAENWLAFQTIFSDVLPLVPIYGNVYYDLFINDLYGYRGNAYWNYGTAIVYATFEKPVEELPAGMDAEGAEGGDTVIID